MPYPASAETPGTSVRFLVTDDALAMVSTLGGRLHCFVGGQGCRARSLAFTLDTPRRGVECAIDVPGEADEVDWEGTDCTPERLAALADRVPLAECAVTLAHDLVPLVDGAVLDFADVLGQERFVWRELPAAGRGDRRCTCLRSFGAPRGKRATCLDDAAQGLVTL